MDVEINRIQTSQRRGKLNVALVQMFVWTIKRTGLRHPIIIDKNFNLIDGRYRLAACKHLQWTKIPARLVDEVVEELRQLSKVRTDYTPSEALRKADALKGVLEALAEAGRVGRKMPPWGKTFPALVGGRMREKFAPFVGYSGVTLDKIRTVVAAAWEDPERFERFLEEMDQSRKVDRIYQHVLETLGQRKTRKTWIPQGGLREILEQMRAQLKDAELVPRHVVRDEYGKPQGGLAGGSTYPEWMMDLVPRKTRENADRLIEVIDDILEGRVSRRTELRKRLWEWTLKSGIQLYARSGGWTLPYAR